MRNAVIVVTVACLVCCAATSPQVKKEGIVLSREQGIEIGRKIWKNECGRTIEGLTSWNRGEDFASLGIGHFIWYPPGREGPYEESFPQLLAFLREKKVDVPPWLLKEPDCPWKDRRTFMAERQSMKMRSLRAFLVETVPWQTEFLFLRLEQALPKMLQKISEREEIYQKFYTVAETKNGIYALVDYVNFKGEGTNPQERYQGQGWGLLQVLQSMPAEIAAPEAVAAFAEAAKKVLERRIQNAPHDESRWREGWRKRCDTYIETF